MDGGRMKTAPALIGITSFAVILLVWESAVRFGFINPFFVSEPSAIALSLSRAARSGELWHNVTVSLREFAIGYGLSVVIGVLAGALAGRFRTVEYALDPFLWFLYSAPFDRFLSNLRALVWPRSSHSHRNDFLAVGHSNCYKHFERNSERQPRTAPRRAIFRSDRSRLVVESRPAGYGADDDGRSSSGHRSRAHGCRRRGTVRRYSGSGLQHLVLWRVVENHRYDRFFDRGCRSRRSLHPGIDRRGRAV